MPLTTMCTSSFEGSKSHDEPVFDSLVTSLCERESLEILGDSFIVVGGKLRMCSSHLHTGVPYTLSHTLPGSACPTPICPRPKSGSTVLRLRGRNCRIAKLFPVFVYSTQFNSRTKAAAYVQDHLSRVANPIYYIAYPLLCSCPCSLRTFWTMRLKLEGPTVDVMAAARKAAKMKKQKKPRGSSTVFPISNQSDHVPSPMVAETVLQSRGEPEAIRRPRSKSLHSNWHAENVADFSHKVSCTSCGVEALWIQPEVLWLCGSCFCLPAPFA